MERDAGVEGHDEGFDLAERFAEFGRGGGGFEMADNPEGYVEILGHDVEGGHGVGEGALGVRGWWAAPLLGLATSAVIEFAQAAFLDTRVADARDLVSNTLGSIVGMLLMLLLAFLLSPSRPRR